MADTTVHTEELGEIVIAPEVLEVIIGITTAKSMVFMHYATSIFR